MKVLQINSVCGIGSTGRIATDIHDVLIKRDHDSYIAYGRDIPVNCDNSIKIGTKYDNYGHVALTRIVDLHGFGSKKATQDFISEVEEIDPDIIHLHNIHGYYINIEILFSYLKKVNKPVIWTLHDCWAFTGHCSYFDYVGCDKWKTECSACPQKKTYPKSLLKDNSKNNFIKKKELFTGVENMTIVSPSKWLATLVKESFLKEYPVKIINNGINLEVFQPTKSMFRQKHNLNNKFIILGVASSWEDRKGYKYFIEMSKTIHKDEVIIIVGLTEKQKETLPENIIGITRTNDVKELAEIYSASDVFVNPTLEDNFPTTNLEAIACGLPVITFNTGGSIESVNESVGFIIEKGNLDELNNAVGNVRKVGKQHYTFTCEERASDLYNKEVRLLEYIDLYEKLQMSL